MKTSTGFYNVVTQGDIDRHEMRQAKDIVYDSVGVIDEFEDEVDPFTISVDRIARWLHHDMKLICYTCFESKPIGFFFGFGLDGAVRLAGMETRMY